MAQKNAPKKAPVKKASKSLAGETTSDEILQSLKTNLNEISPDLRTTDLWDERMKLFRTTHGHEVVDVLESSDYLDEWLAG